MCVWLEICPAYALGLLLRTCDVRTCTPVCTRIFQQPVSINTFNQKHTWPDLQQAFQHHSEHTLDIGCCPFLSLPKPEPPTGLALFCQITGFSAGSHFSRLIYPRVPFSSCEICKICHSASHCHSWGRERRQTLLLCFLKTFLNTPDVQDMLKVLYLVTIRQGSLLLN